MAAQSAEARVSRPDEWRMRYLAELTRVLGPVDELVARAFADVDRADFVSGFFTRGRKSWTWVAADRRPLPDDVAELVYSNRPLVTVVGLNGLPASSSSMPGLMMAMLGELGAAPGMRVLEIGTGTGYNAALLARIVGDTGQVTTIESDADVAAGAAANLDRAGFAAVQVVNGDGAAGAPTGAPYDRLIATAGCTVLPDTWWDQLAPDGVALVPLSRGATYPLAALRRGPARGDWSGRYAGHANFMAAVGPGLGGDAGGWTTARLDADVPVAEEEIDCSPRELEDLGVFAALDVPGARLVRLAGGSLAPRLVAGLGVVDPDGGAAVLCGNRLYAAGGHAADRLREAIGRWRTLGSPDLRGYRIAVTGPGHPEADPVPGAARSWRCRRGAAAEVVSLLGAGEVEP